MGGLRYGMTCREVECWLLSHGFERMPTGKGSHRRYARGPDRVTLPYRPLPRLQKLFRRPERLFWPLPRLLCRLMQAGKCRSCSAEG